MTSFETFSGNALVVGASKGIGLAIAQQIAAAGMTTIATYRTKSRELELLEKEHAHFRTVQLDAQVTQHFDSLKHFLASTVETLELVVVAMGFLHEDRRDAPLTPEKSCSDLDLNHQAHAFQTNATAPLMVAKICKPFLRKSDRPVFAALSAKVGSITDNKIGGWYSYRMSKAALNMGLKTFSLELSRLNKSSVVLAIHPGTTQTQLSAPFMKNAQKHYKIHTPEQSARNILSVLESKRGPSQTGRFFSWDAQELPW